MPEYTPLTVEELHRKLSELLTQQSPHTPTNVLQVEVTDTNPRQRRTIRLWTISYDRLRNNLPPPVLVEELEESA